MGFADVWNHTLVYFGIAEDEEWDEDGLETQEELEREYARREQTMLDGVREAEAVVTKKEEELFLRHQDLADQFRVVPAAGNGGVVGDQRLFETSLCR